MAKFRLYAVLNTVGLAITLLVNYLANAIPIGGKTTEKLLRKFLRCLHQRVMPLLSGALFIYY
ncbi:hypothetical protein AAAC51_19935 [Priestia megaterium]